MADGAARKDFGQIGIGETGLDWDVEPPPGREVVFVMRDASGETFTSCEPSNPIPSSHVRYGVQSDTDLTVQHLKPYVSDFDHLESSDHSSHKSCEDGN